MEYEMDMRGLKCPLPVLKAEKKLSSLSVGDVLRVRADDPLAQRDFEALCARRGWGLDVQFPAKGEFLFTISLR